MNSRLQTQGSPLLHLSEYEAVEKKFAEFNTPPAFVASFMEHYRRYLCNQTQVSSQGKLSPSKKSDFLLLDELEEIDPGRAHEICQQLVTIKLNGGLGTSMHLSGPKSLIRIRDGLSFLTLSARQICAFRDRYRVETPLMLMNSYVTRDPCLAELTKIDFSQRALPLDFFQYRAPRISATDNRPVSFPADRMAEWHPGGHGDIYLALEIHGIFELLLSQGFRWVFASNIDNLGATIDLRIPHLLDMSQLDFAMEVTATTEADKKGGTVCHRGDQLVLVESAQLGSEERASLARGDIFSAFNTNNLWWRIETARDLLRSRNLKLPTIVNKKTIHQTEVVQLESAMGAAITNFPRSKGLLVSRKRFAPVKTTADLLSVRSDAYVLDEFCGLRLNPRRSNDIPPIISLDGKYFADAGSFERRFADTPSLVNCQSLQVLGDVSFGRNVQIKGCVKISAHDGHSGFVPDDTILDNDDIEL